MLQEKRRILYVSNPQTSKNEALQHTDLMSNSTYALVVNEFDGALSLPARGSLHFERQIASVVMSVASHRAFTTGLNERVQPGLIDASRSIYIPVLTGHSIGEMASLIEAGVCSIPTMAWMLNEREKITQRPLESALRQMVAFVGVNADQLEANLNQFSSRFADELEFHMANFNTDRQVVFAMKILRGDVATALERLTGFIPEIKDPKDDSKSLFPKVRLHPLLANGFHTVLMRAEEAIYIPTINPVLTEDNFQVPQARTVYSPTLPGWVDTLDETFDVVRHILTKPVQFSKAMREAKQIPNLVAVVTADVLEVTPKMVRENIGKEIPILNIKDLASLDAAIEKAAVLVTEKS